VAVVDWEEAAFGDPLADASNARLEVLWAFGADAMDGFTRRYESLADAVDFTHLPFWDLRAGLHLVPRISTWGLPVPTQQAMHERGRAFIAQAVERASR
jgi:hypothetical protein